MSNILGSFFNPHTRELQFKVFSKNAACIKIFFYNKHIGEDEVFTKTLSPQGDIWTVSFPIHELTKYGLSSTHIFYGYRAWGPNWEYSESWEKGGSLGFICDVDQDGNRFNPNKLLIDPYAKELSHDPQVAKIYMDPNSYINDYYGGEYRCIDTGKIAPKSILVTGNTLSDFGTKPKRLLKDDIIYEVNLRGFSKKDELLPENEQGTYKGAAKKAGFLKHLGITAVEFLPVHEFADEQNDDGDPRGDNYWGYMSINYFSPNRRYSSDKSPGGPTLEFKKMVKAFHDEGIKVILDVVYNHTGEGTLKRKLIQGSPSSKEEIEKTITEACYSRGSDELQDKNAACILSYSGLDNKSYYFLRDANSRYEGRGGCGGNLNYDNYAVKNLIIDSLKYWADEMGVDGFRFDLAPVLNLTNTSGEFSSDENCTIFKNISSSLPSRGINFEHGVDLIAEPWGDGSYIDWTDKFPCDWSVWNMYYRDTLKTAFNKHDIINIGIGEISKVLSGSKEIIGKKPYNSINYIVSHDDCNSLRNVFSFNAFFHLDEAVIKNNQLSWNQGGSIEMQKKAVRNAFTLLMFSAGVPMFAGGDELFRAIPAYNKETGSMNMVSVDRPDVYLDFSKYNEMKRLMESGNFESVNHLLKTDDSLQIFYFVKNLIDFRNKHECLRPDNYFKGNITTENGLKDITWYNAFGCELSGSDWLAVDFLAYRINSQFEALQNGKDRITSIYVAYNKCSAEKKVLLPENVKGKDWNMLFDTYNPIIGFQDNDNINDNHDNIIHGQSIRVFVEI